MCLLFCLLPSRKVRTKSGASGEKEKKTKETRLCSLYTIFHHYTEHWKVQIALKEWKKEKGNRIKKQKKYAGINGKKL